MPKGRPRKKIEPLVVKTQEMKLEEAKREVMDRMLDPKNITPEKMPSFAGLDSYDKFVSEPEIEGDDPVEIEVGSGPEPQKPQVSEPDRKEGGNVLSEGDSYVVVDPPKKKPNNFENLKFYNKMKVEIKEAESRAEIAEAELEDVKKQLDSTISERNSLSERIRELEASVAKTRGMVPKEKYDKVVADNDSLLLRNSELELEVSIARESATRANCGKASQMHTYSPPGYTQVPQIRDTRQSMNGYQDWV